MVETIEALTIFLYLLPGVLGQFVYESLAERKPADTQAKVTIIVIFSFLSVLIYSVVFAQPILPVIDPNVQKTVPQIFESFFGSNIGWSTLIAVLLGFAAAWAHNKNFLIRVFKFTGVTKQTGKIDVWHQVFTNLEGKWCRVVYKDGKRLVGWPKYYAMHAKNGAELFLADATWHTYIANNWIERDVAGQGILLVNFENVDAIEILDGS